MDVVFKKRAREMAQYIKALAPTLVTCPILRQKRWNQLSQVVCPLIFPHVCTYVHTYTQTNVIKV